MLYPIRLTTSQEDLKEHCPPGNIILLTQKQRLLLRMKEIGLGKGHKQQHNATYSNRLNLGILKSLCIGYMIMRRSGSSQSLTETICETRC